MSQRTAMAGPNENVGRDGDASSEGVADVPRGVRRWIRLFSFVVVAAVLATATLNFTVNPFAYYPFHLLPAVVWSSRQAKVDLLSKAPPPEVLILGSSRSMKVAPLEIERLTGESAFNAAVDSARVEDWYAIAHYAYDLPGARLRELVIGIDVESFHDHVDADGRLFATEALRPYEPISMRLRGYSNALASLIAWNQTISSVHSIRLHFAGYPKPESEFDADGLLHYRVEETKMVDGSFVLDVAPGLREYDGRYAHFVNLDRERQSLFERLLEEAMARGLRVRGFATPMHHSLVEHLISVRDFARLKALLVSYAHALADRFPNFTFADFTDASSFGADPDAFFDAAHANDDAMKHLVAKLLRP